MLTFKKCTANSAWKPSPIWTNAWSGLFRRSLILTIFPYIENRLKSLSSSILCKKKVLPGWSQDYNTIETHENSNDRGKLTSEFRLDTRTVHLSFVPVIPGGKPFPKAAAIAAALPIYILRQHNKHRSRAVTISILTKCFHIYINSWVKLDRELLSVREPYDGKRIKG